MGKRRVEVLPARALGEDERVQAREEPQRRLPPETADERRDASIAGEPTAEVGVERRTLPLALLRLVAESRFLFAQAAWDDSCAALACSAIAVNAPGSATAKSAKTFRSSSIPALYRPEMNWL